MTPRKGEPVIFAHQMQTSALRPLGNGKLGELIKWVMTMVVTAIVAYFTALGAIDRRVTRVETLQETNFNDVLRQLDRIEAELVRLRSIK